MTRNTLLSAEAGEIEQLATIKEVWSRSLDVLARNGVQWVVYNTVDQDFGNPFVLTNLTEIYRKTDPVQDPFLSHCCNSYDITLTGLAFLSTHDYLPQSAKAFITDAAKQGFQSGLGIPMRLTGSHRFGGFNLGTRLDKEEFNARILPKAEMFRLFCLLVHRRIEELTHDGDSFRDDGFRDLLVAPTEPILDSLSPREREVIYLVTRGISRKECARLCGISPHTVAEYTKSAYRKLGVQNRVEATHLVLKRSG
jgi:DNA-binding CsgD family transcriptional regulator